MKQIKSTLNNLFRLAAAMLAACALSANAQSGPETQNAIQSLGIASVQGGKVVLKVGMKSALPALPAAFTISAPPRIAFDFPNTANALGKQVQEFGEGDLRSANIVQAGNRTRLVINLGQMLSHDARVEGNTLLITLQSRTADETAASPASRFAEARPVAQKHSLRDVDFHRGRNGEGRVQVDLSDSNMGIDIKRQGKVLIVDFLKTGLPRNLQRKLDVTDFGTPVEGIDTFVQGEDVRMVIEPKGLWEQAAYQTDNKFIVEIKPVAEDPNKVLKGGPAGYSGEKLTLNFQNISVREALYVIGDFINSNNIPMNMIISESVTGNLTLRLKDVPWDQALDIILESKDLDRRVNGNVMQIAKRDELAAKEKINLAAQSEIADLEMLRTESFQLSYQKGDAVAAMLTNEKQRILSKRGSAVVDPRTNTLFVKDTSSGLEEARKLIKQIDVPVRQVMIEARFVEATDNFNQTLGGKLGFRQPAVAAGGGSNVLTVGGTATQGQVDVNVNLPQSAYTAGTGGLLVSLFNSAATKVLTLELTASELDGITKSIASPRVVTADSTEATIEQGVEIPYSTVSSSGTNVQFKKANLSLKVTPKITPDNNVDMKLGVNQDTVGTSYGGVPSVNTNQVNTQVLVENGGTVVIGGVYKQSETKSTTKVPLLGDVPVLGWLFKNENRTDNKTELLIFITPKVLKETLSLR
jgi:type IV pilus assembly protein PilQ